MVRIFDNPLMEYELDSDFFSDEPAQQFADEEKIPKHSLTPRAIPKPNFKPAKVTMMGMPDLDISYQGSKKNNVASPSGVTVQRSPGLPTVKSKGKRRVTVNANAMTLFEEVSKLNNSLDACKSTIAIYEAELKTLRIVNRRQELAIQRMDKDQNDLPRIVHQLSQEFTGLKKAHSGCLARIANAERSSTAHIDQTLKLQDQLLKLNMILKTKNLDDFERLQKLCDRLRDDIERKDAEIEELYRRLKISGAEKVREIKELRARIGKGLCVTSEADHQAKSNSALSFYSAAGSAVRSLSRRSVTQQEHATEQIGVTDTMKTHILPQAAVGTEYTERVPKPAVFASISENSGDAGFSPAITAMRVGVRANGQNQIEFSNPSKGAPYKPIFLSAESNQGQALKAPQLHPQILDTEVTRPNNLNSLEQVSPNASTAASYRLLNPNANVAIAMQLSHQVHHQSETSGQNIVHAANEVGGYKPYLFNTAINTATKDGDAVALERTGQLDDKRKEDFSEKIEAIDTTPSESAQQFNPVTMNKSEINAADVNGFDYEEDFDVEEEEC